MPAGHAADPAERVIALSGTTVEREMLRGARKLRAGLKPSGHELPPELCPPLEQRLDN